MTTTGLPSPGELPEVEVDPAAFRHLADAQVNVELDTGDMVLNIGPQHPATHGTLRLVVVPSPSFPSVLMPQHFTAPPVVTAQVWLSPPANEATPDEAG